jgi:excisionase family DNA binding protein
VDPLLLTYAQVAQMLRISLSKVKELVRTGQLKTIAIDSSKRVPVSDVHRFVVDRLEQEAS